MKKEEPGLSPGDASYQCNFVILSRREKIKGMEDVSGREFAEDSFPSDNKTVKKEGL